MPVLHLGVADQSYDNKGNAGQTTGEVAKILEDKYGVMRAFFLLHGPDVAGALSESVCDALEALLMGAPSSIDAFGAGTSKIEDLFKQFLSSQEAERAGIPGAPTAAALKGVNHRLKRPYAKVNPRRPSFVDTGLYAASFKSWID